jgi:hypothetical protein
MSFKIGQKVVFINNVGADPDCVLPQLHEVVTVKGYCRIYRDHLDIIEYPVDKFGAPQCILAARFRPVDYSFGEELCSSLEENVKTVEMV